MTIHPVNDENLDQYATIHNAIWMEWPMTVAELQHENAVRDPRCQCERWIARNAEGELVALAEYEQNVYNYHPQKFSIHIGALYRFRKSGIGTKLYDFILEELASFNSIKFSTYLCETWEDSLAFT
jgi:hypothetical protein